MVEFVARASGLHPWDAVFLCGDHDALGRWRADAVRLDWSDGTFRTRLALPAGTRVRYLFTRGNWRGGELDGNGQEHRPREVVAEPGLRVEVEVPGWGRNSVRYHRDFRSQFLPHARTIAVHLPPEYDLHPHLRYPVLYLHDGQNLFDAETSFAGVPWGCDESADRLARCGATADEHDLSAAYARFLIEELKPFIDAEYRTRPGRDDTGVGGSSMGGLISLELTRRHPTVFGRCAALSSSLWWDRERLLHEVGDHPGQLSHARLWLDMGTQEGPSDSGLPPMVRRARRLAFHLRRLPPEQFRYTEVDGGEHNEWAWAHRFPDVLRFLFPR